MYKIYKEAWAQLSQAQPMLGLDNRFIKTGEKVDLKVILG